MALDEATNPMQGVSGPGKFAKRTDLEYQSNAYGDGVQYQADKSGAPLATAPKSPMLSQAPQVPSGDGTAGIGLYDSTTLPERDIMHGNKLGPGAGPEALSMQSGFAAQKLSDTLAQMLPYDQTGEVAVLYQQALSRGM
jgi:hypothetical protein